MIASQSSTSANSRTSMSGREIGPLSAGVLSGCFARARRPPVPPGARSAVRSRAAPWAPSPRAAPSPGRPSVVAASGAPAAASIACTSSCGTWPASVSCSAPSATRRGCGAAGSPRRIAALNWNDCVSVCVWGDGSARCAGGGRWPRRRPSLRATAAFPAACCNASACRRGSWSVDGASSARLASRSSRASSACVCIAAGDPNPAGGPCRPQTAVDRVEHGVYRSAQTCPNGWPCGLDRGFDRAKRIAG